MKRLLQLFCFIMSAGIISEDVLSCTIFSSNFLSDLPNFDWNNFWMGDGTNYAYQYNADQNLIENENIEDIGSLKPDIESSYLDYTNINTGYQYFDSIKKQAVTGAPLDKNYNFNGNKYSDFGINYNSRKYMYKNSVLDWNSEKDIDSKYLKSTIPLQKSVDVATGSVGNQDSRLNFNFVSDPSINHRSYNSDNVGRFNPYEKTNLNWQYETAYTNWGGSWFEGMIEIPNVGLLEAAHRNGVKVYGTIFMSGYNGLTREDLKDFIAKDENGNYKIVDILINFCQYYGFDGYFINNESNGNKPNGSVLDYNQLIDIVAQFNKKVAENNEDLKIVYYNSYATLGYSSSSGTYKNNETYMATQNTIFRNKNGNNYSKVDVGLDFGDTVGSSKYFLNNDKIGSQYYKGSDIYNIVDVDYRNQFLGLFDYRPLTYSLKKDGSYDTDSDIYNSLMTFSGGVESKYPEALRTKSPEIQKIMNGTNEEQKIKTYLYLRQVDNLYNGIFFNGINTHCGESSDSGMTAVDLYKIQNSNYNLDYMYLDPRIKDKYDMSDIIDSENATNGTIKYQDFIKNVIEEKNIDGSYANSYGIGDLITPHTVIQDDDGKNNNLNFITNFSSGNGVNFFYHNDKGELLKAANDDVFYPWYNNRLQDVLPTYQWNIYQISNGTKKQELAQNLSGYYDYYDAYYKGNCISLGSGFDKDGKIIDGKWDVKTQYNWEIFGTSLSSSNHTINIRYKTNIKDSNLEPEVKFLVSTTDQTSDDYKTVDHVIDGEISKNGDWNNITLDLSSLSNINVNNKISKIGLSIIPKSKEFKFSIGEFGVDQYDENEKIISKISDLNSELVIKRIRNNSNYYNVRFKWNINNEDDINFYEIFYFNYDLNKYVLAGETDDSLYYLKELKSKNNKIKIGIMPYYRNNKKGKLFSFDLDV